MPQASTTKLDGGDQFPATSFPLASGGTFSIPDDLSADYTILLIYRGKW